MPMVYEAAFTIPSLSWSFSDTAGAIPMQICKYLPDPPSYEEFYANYLLPNKPVIVGPSLISSWNACQTWVSPSDAPLSVPAHINWDHLSNEYGQYEVTVADCATREFSDQKRQTMLFRDVIDLWKAGHGNSLYVKDWHLPRAITSDPHCKPPFYLTPDIFRDDWMNAYYSACTDDDFRFVYVGAAGTFTPLHRDVYTSYSWSTNICGRKRWWLFPPEQTKFLSKRGREGEIAFDVRDINAHDFTEFKNTRPIMVEQKDGETIFVPSGWYHQVENLTACISINHNWCNSVNLPSLYDSMCEKVVEVEQALEDVKELLSQSHTDIGKGTNWQHDWVQIVQDVVEKDAGWNWMTFWKMVLHALRAGSREAGPNCKPCVWNWQYTPPDLTPSRAFVTQRVRACYKDFLSRDRREVELVNGLGDVLQAVGAILRSDGVDANVLAS